MTVRIDCKRDMGKTFTACTGQGGQTTPTDRHMERYQPVTAPTLHEVTRFNEGFRP